VRRRLLLIYLSLLSAVLLSLALPLAATIAARDTQAAFITQLNETGRFASLAEQALSTGETVELEADLVRYDELFGVGAAVVDMEGEVLVSSRRDLPWDDRDFDRRLDAGRSGERTGGDRVIWPWQDRPLVLVEPVTRDGETIGAAVTVAPTGAVRRQTAQRWAVVAVAALFALALSWLAAARLTRWTLRPVHQLDDVTHEITAGRLESRVAAATGPVELRRLATSFNTMADTVTGALARQRAFVAHASHQLRTPLGALLLRVENLAEHLRPSGRREHALALEETARLSQVLDGLLALARAEGDRHEVEPVDAAEVADARVKAWQPVAERRGVRLVRTGGVDRPAVAVPGALDQALDALIDNALKFGADGGKEGGTVTVHLTSGGPDEDSVEVHVIDGGGGLDEDGRAHAVERFWRAPVHQNLDGSGLGLAIVRVLVDASGGRLDLLPAEPHGLDARVRLPAAEAGDAGASKAPPAPG
jgi:signal transduction histidine kinase